VLFRSIRNSWGPTWNNNGHAWLPYSDFGTVHEAVEIWTSTDLISVTPQPLINPTPDPIPDPIPDPTPDSQSTSNTDNNLLYLLLIPGILLIIIIYKYKSFNYNKIIS
jgi:hypothetical protein